MARITSLPIRHEPSRCRNNCHSESVHHLWQHSLSPVDPESRSTDSLQRLNYRSTLEVPKQNGKLRLAIHLLHRKISYVTLLLQNPRDLQFLLGHRHHCANLARRLSVSNPGQHIRYGILHAHIPDTSLSTSTATNSPLPSQVRPRSLPPHATCCAQDRIFCRTRAGGRSIDTCSAL